MNLYRSIREWCGLLIAHGRRRILRRSGYGGNLGSAEWQDHAVVAVLILQRGIKARAERCTSYGKARKIKVIGSRDHGNGEGSHDAAPILSSCRYGRGT